MPPIPVNKLTELALSRRKLFEKIMQHVASRKIQNHMQATGDRMSVTPQQFGMQVGKTMGKQAFVTLPITAGVGAGLGAVTSPSGHRMEGLGRGAVKGTGTGAGMIGGGIGGALGALALAAASPRIGKTLFGPSAAQLADALKRFVQRGGRTMSRGGKKVPIRSPGQLSPYSDAYLRNAIVRGGTTGAVGGAGLGYAGASAAIGKPSWENKEAGAGSSILKSLQKGLGKATKTLASDDVFYPAVAGTAGAGGALAASEAYRSLKTPAAKPVAPVNKTLLLKRIVGGLDRDGLSPFQQMTAPLMRVLTGTPDVPRYGAQKQSSLLSTLGGVAGGGIGGLAGGAGGGIMGALAGGALGGGPGAGIGLLAGGAAGLGAGAHLGSNIGSSIGKKKKKPESDEKEEKSEEKSEDSGDEEVKKSAAAVLAQLQKNAVDPAAYSRVFGKGKGQEMANRQQGMAQQAQQLRAANPGATTMSGTFQQGKLMPQPAPTSVPAPSAAAPTVSAAPPYPKKSVTSDDAADFF
jgi:hypothetical protein